MTPRSSGPIFLVGSMRSGSTMLRLILDSHPSIAIGPETGFMGAVQATKEIPNFTPGRGWYRQLNWTDEEFGTRLREFYDEIFGRYAAEQGKPRWGEKTPFHTGHIMAMADLFPEAAFVGIVRHPGAVARSLEKNFHYTFADAVAYWAGTNVDLVSGGAALGPRFALCRYEDLVRDSEPVLLSLTQFLGEPWSPSLLAHHEVQREKGAPRVTNGSTVTRDPIDAARAERWADTMSTEDSRALAEVRQLAGFFGYDPLDPHVSPFRWGEPVTQHTVRGDLLADRWAGLDDRLPPARPAHLSYVDASPDELAQRLARAEAALERTRSRRAVRLADAVRRAQRGRSVADLRAVWSLVREPQPWKAGSR